MALTYELLVEHIFSTLVPYLFVCAEMHDLFWQVGSEPVNAFAKKLRHQFAFTVPKDGSGVNAVHQPLSRETLQQAVRSFTSHLVDRTVFECDSCGDWKTAPILIGDATAIAPPKKLSCDPPIRQFGDQVKHGSAHANRVLVPDPALRELIFLFCGQSTVKIQRTVPFFSRQVRFDTFFV